MKDTWDGERDPLAALRAGRSGPFEAFAQAEVRTFLGFFARLGATRSEAEDLTQDTFLKLYASAAQVHIAPESRTAAGPEEAVEDVASTDPGYDARGQFAGYAFRVARNVWIDRVRKASSGRSASASEVVPGGADLMPDPHADLPEARAMRLESTARIRAAVASLPDAHREVFELAVVEELRYSAIAEALDIPVGTVKSRMHNAVRRVRGALEEEDRVRDTVRTRAAEHGGSPP